MKVKELLSVIVPVYNAAAYLRKCVRSIQDQTYNNLDIILIDDGSLDDSGKMCDELAEIDGRIQVYHIKNQGVVNARNYGVDKARGNLITFVDSDDWIEPDMYLKMLEVYEKYKPDIISTGIIYESAAGVRTLECDLILEGIYDRSQIEQEIIPVMMYDVEKHRRAVISAVGNKIIKKNLLWEVLQKVDRKITYGEDASIVYLCLAKAEKAAFINCAWYHYCIKEDSMVRRFDISSFERIKYFIDYMETAYIKLGIWEQMNIQVREYAKYFLYPAIETVFDITIGKVLYLFPYELIERGSRVVIYGAGKVGQAYMRLLNKADYVEVEAWVDRAYDKFSEFEERVWTPAVLSKMSFDYIVIAVENEETALGIKQDLKNIGVSENKIIWKKPEIIQGD